MGKWIKDLLQMITDTHSGDETNFWGISLLFLLVKVHFLIQFCKLLATQLLNFSKQTSRSHTKRNKNLPHNENSKQKNKQKDLIAGNSKRETEIGKNESLVQEVRLKQEMQMRERKQLFLASKQGHEHFYGYSKSSRGHIDTWRSYEFPTLIHPIQLKSKEGNGDDQPTTKIRHDNDLDLEVYLDYAGASLPSQTQLKAMYSNMLLHSQILANPHSNNGPAASRSMALIESVRKQVLDFFGANPGFYSHNGHRHHYNDSNEVNNPDTHPGYEVIFTSGTTEALKIVSENFPWTNDQQRKQMENKETNTTESSSNESSSLLIYPHNAHTSVIGMRGPAMANGARFRCENLSNICNASPEVFVSWVHGDHLETPNHSNDRGQNEESTNSREVNHLLVVPSECNFGGRRPNINQIFQNLHASSKIMSSSDRQTQEVKHQWWTMLDLAKEASTSSINLRELNPDFACVSFYKIFGAPTGVGALFVKRTSAHLLTSSSSTAGQCSANEHRHKGMRDKVGPPENRHKQRYFGGGSVDVVLPKQNFMFPKANSSALPSLVHGTVDFRGIASLSYGFTEIKDIGGMNEVCKHTQVLAFEAVQRLRNMKHANGNPVVEIYGAWSECPTEDYDPTYLYPGPTIAFNVLRYEPSRKHTQINQSQSFPLRQSYVGYNEVSKLAALFHHPIQLRVGCFCNPGSCQEALQLTDEDIKSNFLHAGHVCGDNVDIINGKPTGAVRISFGKYSIWEDMDNVVSFIEKTFSNHTMGHLDNIKSSKNVEKTARISEMYIYPIKSCGAMRVKKWKMGKSTGKLLFDREFALVDFSGSALRLSTYPKMALIQPTIDVENQVLTVKAPDKEDLAVNLRLENDDVMAQQHIKVCGKDCSAKLWNYDASRWFSSFLGIQCWLVRHYKSEDSGQIPQPKTQQRKRKLPKSKIDRNGFENEAPLLLIAQDSVDILNSVLEKQGSVFANSKYFRPNIVIGRLLKDAKSSSYMDTKYGESYKRNPEDVWEKIVIPRHQLELSVLGQCARCSMVDIDPSSGLKGKTLKALAEYRRIEGQITFGIFLAPSSESTKEEDVWIEIEEDDLLIAYSLSF